MAGYLTTTIPLEIEGENFFPYEQPVHLAVHSFFQAVNLLTKIFVKYRLRASLFLFDIIESSNRAEAFLSIC